MTDGPHFLLVGDSRDIPAIGGMLGRLPVGAMGQVYLEVASAIQIRKLAAPSGMSITWLCRDSVTSRSGAVAARGELAVRAVEAWISEWLPDDDAVHPNPYVMWIGCSTSPAVTELYRSLADRLGDAHLHHPHH